MNIVKANSLLNDFIITYHENRLLRKIDVIYYKFLSWFQPGVSWQFYDRSIYALCDI